MPRNPHKQPCSIEGCRNWAARGHPVCHSHRGLQPGHRSAGPPPGNLNALKTGRDAHPLTRDALQSLASAIALSPQDLPLHIGRLAATLQDKTGDPLRTLVALHVVLVRVADLLVRYLFNLELDDLLGRLPPECRLAVETTVRKRSAPFSPANRLVFLRRMAKVLLQKYASKTITGTGTPTPAPAGPDAQER